MNTKTEVKHAPTKNGTGIASNPGEEDEQWEANAAFIVRAVNAHEELVEASKTALTYLLDLERTGAEDCCKAIEDLKAALVKAEGGEA